MRPSTFKFTTCVHQHPSSQLLLQSILSATSQAKKISVGCSRSITNQTKKFDLIIENNNWNGIHVK